MPLSRNCVRKRKDVFEQDDQLIQNQLKIKKNNICDSFTRIFTKTPGDVVWKWSVVCSCSWRSNLLVHLAFSLQDTSLKLLSVRSELWRVFFFFCALLHRRSARLVSFTCEATETEAQASTRPHCCLSHCSHHLISAQGLTGKILSFGSHPDAVLQCVHPLSVHTVHFDALKPHKHCRFLLLLSGT